MGMLPRSLFGSDDFDKSYQHVLVVTAPLLPAAAARSEGA